MATESWTKSEEKKMKIAQILSSTVPLVSLLDRFVSAITAPLAVGNMIFLILIDLEI